MADILEQQRIREKLNKMVPGFMADFLGDRLKQKSFGNEPLIDVSPEVHDVAACKFVQMQVYEHTVMRILSLVTEGIVGLCRRL